MRSARGWSVLWAALTVVLALLLGGAAVAAPAQATPTTTQITGSGSTWAANAVNQWISDTNRQGLQVVYTASGSAQGRKDFAYRTTDFGVTELPYQGTDPRTGADDSSDGRPYGYLPITAGATALPFHIGNGTSQVHSLRLSGLTLAKIFTDQITNWDDPEIASDNNGVALPNLPIVPVVDSGQSGATLALTSYLAAQFPSIWGPFNGGSATPTNYFPTTGSQVALAGSDAIINYIGSAAGNGSIGIDQYSYALLGETPVAKLLNAAGYYSAPTPDNVAIALSAATVNDDPASPNYLTADVNGVYTDTDPRTYPLSSYSYLIIPTGANRIETKTTTTAARQAIADFAYYSICTGQTEAAPIGYAPLPLNLVQAGLDELGALQQADPNVDLTGLDLAHCGNPTFLAADPSPSYLEQTAPEPAACDEQGHAPCATPTTVGVGLGGNYAQAGRDATLTARVTPAADGTVAFYDNGASSPLPGTITTPSPGSYSLDVPTGFAQGGHSVVATFTPSDPAAYEAAQSLAVTFDTGPATISPCSQPGSVCTDPQDLQATVPVGTLAISTPYTASAPLELGYLALSADARTFSGSAPFDDIVVSDARAGDQPWTATALASPLTDGGSNPNSVINAENLGLTALSATPAAGFAGSLTLVDNVAADGVAPDDPGSAGLGGTGVHTVASADHGEGSVTLDGTLTLNAPSSTESGLFSGTITFTVG